MGVGGTASDPTMVVVHRDGRERYCFRSPTVEVHHDGRGGVQGGGREERRGEGGRNGREVPDFQGLFGRRGRMIWLRKPNSSYDLLKSQ